MSCADQWASPSGFQSRPRPTLQVSGVCEVCAQQWTATVPLDRIPHVRCVCGHRHVVEFVFSGIPVGPCLDERHHALPGVN